MNLTIKTLDTVDDILIKNIVSIHKEVLTDSFLNNFGEEFLKIIYTNSIKSEENICVYLMDYDILQGFALATTNYSVFLKNAFKKNKIKLCLLLLLGVIKKPKILYSLIISTPSILFSKETPHPELQFIGITKKSQGRGYGSMLIKKVEQEFFKKGIYKYYVGTKEKDPMSNKFYQKLEFEKVYSKKYFGENLNFYLSKEIKNY